ncbi:MAG: GTPase Era [Kiritimatiellae bacterium]|nr:GTPase Era [Kiritimatiellia bacterium]
MEEARSETPAMRKCAVVGIVGRTNSGKSSLINQMVGEKVSIVSPVQQTTRNTIRAILTEDRGQLVFRDTPGLHKAESTLGTLMNRMARAASAGTDVLCVVFDASKMPQLEDDGWMRRVVHEESAVVFVLNKADRFRTSGDGKADAKSPETVQKFHELWRQIQEEKKSDKAVTWIETCALTPKGVQPLLDKLFELALPSEELLFPEDIVTDYPRKLAISDVIREKFLQRLHDEVPHELGIKIDQIEESPKKWDVNVTIYVNRPSQKFIVIGTKARTLKFVRERAEPELSDMFGVQVRLYLWVKIERDWMKNFWLLREMGYAGSLQ